MSAPRGSLCSAVASVFGEPGSRLVAVDHKAAERREKPEHQEDVEQRRAAHDELEPVERKEETRHAAKQGRPGHPPGDAGEQQDGKRPDDRDGEPPSERIEAEHPSPAAMRTLPIGG